jgi:hypothetical protein
MRTQVWKTPVCWVSALIDLDLIHIKLASFPKTAVDDEQYSYTSILRMHFGLTGMDL